MLPQASVRQYRTQQRLEMVARMAVRRAWRQMTPELDASWPQVRAQAQPLVTAAQVAAAHAGAQYVGEVLEETGQVAEVAAQVVAGAFGGVASDGRPLESLLYGGVTHAKQAVGAGAKFAEALQAGERFLDMVTWTQVADAGRAAASVGITARPRVGWVRMVNPPCCSRCAILAGRWYRWSDGFLRHPRCDCRHVPSLENRAGDFTTDPQALVDRGQLTDLTKAERDALTEGADLTRVVNARRGSKGMTTTEGTTRAGQFRRETGLRVRLTPEGIYREAEDRTDAIRLLRRHGYLT